jgi:Flp pilus assembly protein TadB
MLSNEERRELARIEQALREDPDWREPRGAAASSTWWRRWGIRVLAAFSGLVMLVGVVTTTGDLLLEGVLLMGAACCWWLCRQVAEAKAAERQKDQQPES